MEKKTNINEPDNRPVMERIKTFADACYEVGIEDSVEWEANYAMVEPDILAYMKLRIIAKALNEGWEPKFSTDEYRHYPWFRLLDEEEYYKLSRKDIFRMARRSSHSEGTSCGIVCVGASYDSSFPYSGGCSRLAFKSEELAKYAGQQFVEIYADIVFISGECRTKEI